MALTQKWQAKPFLKLNITKLKVFSTQDITKIVTSEVNITSQSLGDLQLAVCFPRQDGAS